MKKITLLTVVGAMALGLWSCSSDEPVIDNGNGTEGDVYASLTLRLPVGTRSETTDDGGPATSTNGNEVGKDNENNVEDIYVVLASKEADGSYKYVAKSRTNALLDQSKVEPTYSIQFKSEDLEKYVDAEGEGKKTVYIFAYCNPQGALLTTLDALSSTNTSFTDEIANEADGDNLVAATSNKFLMTNALPASKELPSLDVLIKQNNTQAKAFDLGTVKVERVVSRFDFMAKPAADGYAANQYVIKDNVSGHPTAVIEVNGMSLINEAKDYYYLPRTSNNLDWSEPVLCGDELSNNWMVSPNYAEKIAFAANPTGTSIADNYHFSSSTLPQNLVYTMPGGISDNDDWTGAAGTDYKIWRYATENTMPQALNGCGAMKWGITTGVVFRGELKALPADKWATVDGINPAQTIATAIANHETIYAYSGLQEDGKNPQPNIILGSAKDVYRYALSHATSEIRNKFLQACAAGHFIVTIDGNQVTENTEANIFPANVDLTKVSVTGKDNNLKHDNGVFDAVKNFGFVTYKPTQDTAGNYHYYTYYYYYNRHNDNGDPNSVAPMEFATVRNNIYKLRVNSIAMMGLPGDVTPPPSTDDETPEVYFKVSVRVLNWVVRVNNIDF